MSDFIKTLPTHLIKRFHGWKATTFEQNKSWYQKLASQGQHPEQW
jgi:carbonic anhydrase